MTTRALRSWVIASAICSAAVAAHAGQSVRPPDRQATTPVDPQAALAAARRALDGRAVRASFEGRDSGIDIVMNGTGGPRLLKLDGQFPETGIPTDSETVLLHYTGRMATTCSGAPTERELVLEYRRATAAAAWSVRARTRSDIEVLMPVFQMLAGQGDIESEASAQSESVTLARIRPMPPGQQQESTPMMQEVLELDASTWLPSRWYIRVPSIDATPYVLTFAYPDASFRVPAVDPPTCVP